jgi:hypothetical protein
VPAREKSNDSLLSLRVWADLAIMLGILTASSTYLSIDESYNGIFVVLATALVFFGYLIIISFRSIIWLLRGCPRRATASLVKLGVVLLPWLLGIAVGDYVHLALYYSAYQQQIEAHSDGSTTPVRFFWGDKALWVTDGLQADTLVYDPTDALAASIGEVRDTNQAGLGLATRHMIGHFYVEREFSR